MKFKFLSILMACCVALSLNASMNNVTSGDEGNKNTKAENSWFSVKNGITGKTGSKNCFIPELFAPISFEVVGDGDIVDVTATVKIKHSNETEYAPMSFPAELWISGRDDDNRDADVKLKIDNDSQKKLEEWLPAAPGEEVELIFKAKLPKDSLKKLNDRETTNTLVL